MGETGPSPYAVRATSGSLRDGDGVTFPHAWTDEGVLAGPATNGAQVLHLSVALCVLNDVYREAQRLGIVVDGVAVTADGGFDEVWTSTGIGYDVVVDTSTPDADLRLLLEVVEEVAEIPRVLRAGAMVERRPG